MLDFNSFQVRAGLSDAGFEGSPFTWCNNQREDRCVWERLDRVLINGRAAASFPLLHTRHLPRLCSDHCPLLVQTLPKIPRRGRFHYLHMWTSHPDFHRTIQSAWASNMHANPLANFGLKLKRL
ncbi:hypothetical protein QQ045_025195 [Rhodiola kirilowii]